MKFASALAASLAFTAGFVSALPSVTRQGRYLYANGARFFIKGIAYQQQGLVTTGTPEHFPEPSDYTDPLADPDGCARDLPYLQQLGVNTIRVYSVNSAANHDACMKAFSNAGIYVIMDLALPVNGSIDRSSPSWTTNLLNLYTGTIDTFLAYDNVLAFNVGNEVVNDVPTTVGAPFIKAAVRDIKAYVKSKGASTLVSYSSTDGAAYRIILAEYLACGDTSTSLDLYGINTYRWCGDQTIAAYSGLITDYQDYPLPAYFSEFGSIKCPPRLWTEVAAMYGPQMTNEWSGGVAYSYFPTFQGFGMVNLTSDKTGVITGDDFDRLKTQYSQVTFATTPSQADAGTDQQTTCPSTSENFLASSVLPPTPINTGCNCLTTSALTCAFTNGNSPNAGAIAGELLNYICPQLGTKGGSCDAIAANGATGVYGPFSECDAATKLSYAITQYYELFGRAAGTCDFQGNATVVTNGPADSAAAEAAISSCASQAFTGTTIPPAPSSTSKATPGATGTVSSGSGGSSGSGSSSGAMSFKLGGQRQLAVLSVLAGVAVVLL